MTETTIAHKGEYGLMPPFNIAAKYTDTTVPYESREGKLHCAYCGSLHPREVAALIRAGAKLELADMKYGWPHKAYLHNPWGKWYTRHHIDATEEDREVIDRALGIRVLYDPETQRVSWMRWPRPEPSPSDLFNGA